MRMGKAAVLVVRLRLVQSAFLDASVSCAYRLRAARQTGRLDLLTGAEMISDSTVV
jgi:hypothetical protein